MGTRELHAVVSEVLNEVSRVTDVIALLRQHGLVRKDSERQGRSTIYWFSPAQGARLDRDALIAALEADGWNVLEEFQGQIEAHKGNHQLTLMAGLAKRQTATFVTDSWFYEDPPRYNRMLQDTGGVVATLRVWRGPTPAGRGYDYSDEDYLSGDYR